MTSTAKAARELSGICRRIGADPALVQGPGGNVSVKPEDGGLMLIKASGVLLSDVTSEAGYAAVDHDAVASWLLKLPQEIAWSPELEDDYLARMRSSTTGTAMPSLETGFHAALPGAIVHTHPLALNALLCSRDGPEVARSLMPDAHILPYRSVGVVLSRAVAALPAGGRPIFLLNHGLITSGETLEEAFWRTSGIARATRELVGDVPPLSFADGRWRSPSVEDLLRTGGIDEMVHAFPDSVVYAPGYGIGDAGVAAGLIGLFPDGGIDPRVALAPGYAAQMAHAIAYLALAARPYGGLVPLPDNEVAILRGMRSEEYRRKMAEGR